jgi:hypothetical protein
MGRIGSYLTQEERLRRTGELLPKGIYLWAEAVEGTTLDENETQAAKDTLAVVTAAPCAGDELQTPPPTRTVRRAYSRAERCNGRGQSR